MVRSLLISVLLIAVACGPGVDSGPDSGNDSHQPGDVVAPDLPGGDVDEPRDVAGDGTFDAADVAVIDAPGDLPGDLPDDAAPDLPGDLSDDAPETVVDAIADFLPGDVADCACDTADAGDSGGVDDALSAGDADAAIPEGGDDIPDTSVVTDSVGDLPDVADAGGDAGSGGGLAIRIVASNLTSGPYQSYDPGHGIRILDALNPDIVLVQEFNFGDNTASDYNAFVNSVIGTGYWAVDDSTFQIPNGVVSRWPIIASGYWDDPNISNRELMWATIDIPGPVDIMAISVHLHTSPSADQVEAAQVIVAQVRAHRLANPGRFMYVVGGDFNGTSSVSESGFGLDGTFYVDPPDPVDDENNPNTNANRNNQYDYVLGDPAMHAFQVPVVFPSVQDSTSLSYPDGLVFDTRTFTQAQLDEYFPPADSGDSGASYMQHMAVVKDYLVQ